MKSTLFIFTSVLLFILSPGLKAQNAPGQTYTFSLKECLDYAYEHQDSLKNAKLDIQSAEYKIKETNGPGFPQVNGTASLLDYLQVPSMSFGGGPPQKFGTKFQSTLGVSLSQLLFDGGYLIGLKAAKTYRELFQRSYNRTKIAATVAVTKAYYQVLVNDEQLKLLDANIAQLKQQLHETTQMNQQGFVEKIDVDRLTVLYNNLLTDRSNTQQMLTLGIQVLKFQMGMPVTDNLVIEEKIKDVQLNALPVVAIDTAAYRNRVEYSLLQTQTELNRQDLLLTKAASLPTLQAVGSSSMTFMNNSFGALYNTKLPGTYIGLQLNVPIFSGFQRSNRVKQAEIVVKKSENSMGTLKNAINLQIDQARVMYSTGLQSLSNQQKNMDLAREILRVSKIKYDQGVGSSIEVTQAQTALQEAENNYIQALYNVLISKVDLDTAYGNIK